MEVSEGTILIVEDLEQIRELLKVTLTFHGYPVDTAADGLEALKKIEKEPPALIITDLLMPNMDGYAMIYRLRRNKDTREIPIIVLSATYVSTEDKDFALSLGAVRFMEKPIDTADFLLTVGETLANGIAMREIPLDDLTFYTGYRDRLQGKLQQKTQQLARTERLLKTLPDAQKAVFQNLLEEARQHKDEILAELDETTRNLEELEKSG
ncbi:MAG: response regulator [Chloroflexi bacterium]|nr:response regulator [Chloroflexota bacterium]